MNASNLNLRSLLRNAALVAAIASLSLTSHAASSDKPVDRAAVILESTGSVSVASVGPVVKVGSSRAEVGASLGRPSRILADGSWLIYKDFHVDNSVAHGTLLVSFTGGQVSDLKLLTPVAAVAAATRRPVVPAEAVEIAANRR